MSISYQPKGPDDFIFVQKSESIQSLSRVSLSYWQDAWRRLKTNRQAIISLWVIIAIIFFTVAGPVIWQVDPALQDITRTSNPPSLNSKAKLIKKGLPWLGTTIADHPVAPPESWYENPEYPLPATDSISIIGSASTHAVKISWQPVANTSGYLVYRNTYYPTKINELGLPVGETFAGNEVGYEDRLKLEERTYYYSIVATDGVQDSSIYKVIEVPVSQAISIESALEKGLISPEVAIENTIIDLPSHPLGTDYLGRDMLSRLMYGARTSLFIGITAPLIYIFIGILCGAIAGFLGGRWDSLLMRFADFVVALPFLLFMIIFRVAAGTQSGESGIAPMMIALILLLWPATARLVRGQVIQIRKESYVQAAKLLGGSNTYLIFRHMIPNTMGVILVSLTFAIPTAIFIEAFLSFVGLGIAPPTPSWGSMSFEGLKTILIAPHELIFPSVFISITVLAFNLFGDGLRDALDSRMRSS